jgi:hypothetical protein
MQIPLALLLQSAAQARSQGAVSRLVRAIVELKNRNPRFGCPRIAQQLSNAFALKIHKDLVRRVLAVHYRPEIGRGGPTWLTLLGPGQRQPVEHGPVSG